MTEFYKLRLDSETSLTVKREERHGLKFYDLWIADSSASALDAGMWTHALERGVGCADDVACRWAGRQHHCGPVADIRVRRDRPR